MMKKKHFEGVTLGSLDGILHYFQNFDKLNNQFINGGK